MRGAKKVAAKKPAATKAKIEPKEKLPTKAKTPVKAKTEKIEETGVKKPTTRKPRVKKETSPAE